jgi:hypothetical protein
MEATIKIKIKGIKAKKNNINKIKKMIIDDLIARPIHRDIMLKNNSFSHSLRDKLTLVFLDTILFHGKKRVFNKGETEKKYGKKINKLWIASK